MNSPSTKPKLTYSEFRRYFPQLDYLPAHIRVTLYRRFRDGKLTAIEDRQTGELTFLDSAEFQGLMQR